ncbi:hypothetical protein MIDIC_240037 [Alphaproteobacteria bacterium]
MLVVCLHSIVNASLHKLQSTRKMIKKAKCSLLFFSPYSPDSKIQSRNFWLIRSWDQD